MSNQEETEAIDAKFRERYERQANYVADRASMAHESLHDAHDLRIAFHNGYRAALAAHYAAKVPTQPASQSEERKLLVGEMVQYFIDRIPLAPASELRAFANDFLERALAAQQGTHAAELQAARAEAWSDGFACGVNPLKNMRDNPYRKETSGG